ncbi:tetratricopeptide repeat protein [Ralstonia sp. UBA689]|uniref:tetratricopeptide repeat protein n=1 Tax=Ralstonia sp. UBA689 TaxID=1947373 RepID=UPI0025FAB7D3|nr:tetratricopeptide repeat protein [Ralstonia sp. UBA689]
MWSADLTPRERLLPAWLIGTLGALIGLALALMFPRERLEARLLEGGKVDALSVAYLEAWLRVRPNDGEFLSVLAAQYVRTGRLEDAEAMVARMRALHDKSLDREALLLDIAIREQRAYALQPKDPQRAAMLEDLRGLLKQALDYRWTASELEILATKARALDQGAIAVQFYQRLARQDVARASQWQARTAEIALGVGEYRAAAAANFAAQDAAKSLDEQRRYFIAGLKALQSGNLLDDAMTEAQRRVGPLIDDTETLRFLTRLAMACNRPDLADQYARRLLHLSWHRTEEGVALAALAADGARHDWAFAGRPEPLPSPADVVFMDGPEGLARRERHAARIRHVADKAGDAGASSSQPTGAQAIVRGIAPFNAEDYDLAYRVFMGSGNLNDAMRVAEAAVRQRPDLKIWTERAAQVAEWNRQPMAALNYWLAYAQSTGDEAAWHNVLRLAPALNEDHAYLAALRYQASRQPGDMKLLDQIIAAYERLGEPVEGLAYLSSIARGPHRQAVLERYAMLAERAGKDDQAYETYVRLQQEFGPNAQYALKLANILYVRGKFEQALAAMQAATKAATPTDDLYWRTFAQLARLNQRDDLAREAYRQLLSGGTAEPDDLTSMIDFYDASPIDAGRLAELAFRKDGTMVHLQQAIYYYTRARAFRRIDGLLASLTPAQRKAAEQSAGVLGARAEYYRQSGQWDAAMRDLRRAVTLPDAGSDVKAAFLWGLLDSGQNAELKRALALWRGEAENDSAYWGAYAAAGLQLFDANLALRFLGRQGKSMQTDPLWLLAYADAREMAGQADAAWGLRREAWWLLWRAEGADAAGAKDKTKAPAGRRVGTRVTVGDNDAVPLEEEARTELRARRVALAQTFSSGDLSQRLLIELLRDDRRATKEAREGGRSATDQSELGDIDTLPPEPPETPSDKRKPARVSDQLVSAVAKEAALGWALSQEANDLARAWLLQQYARRMTRPAYAEISIALAEHDLQTLNRLLDDTPDRIPLYSRIDANVMTDRLGEAQRLSFEGLSTAPDDDQLHGRVQETLLTNAQALEPRETWFKQAPLTYFESSAAAGIRLTDHYSMLLRATQRNQRSTDDTQLTGVPAQDRSVDWISQYQTQNTQWKGTVGWRQGLASLTAFRLDGLLGQAGPVGTELSIGRNQPANETPQLRVGGVKDLFSIGNNWRLTQNEYVRARVEGDRFYGQDRSFLGSGMVFDGEIGHRFRVEYPDYTIRVVGTYARYNASGTVSPLMARLLPAGAAPDVEQIMPRSFMQFGMLFGFGTDYLDRYTRAWRPFMDVGVLHDNREGWGTQVQLGVAGSVFGNDHLALYIEHQSITRSGTAPLTEIGLRYRWLY